VRYIAVYVRPKAVYLSELQDWITHGKFYYWRENREVQMHLPLSFMSVCVD